jgi:hypothetical protein
MFAFITQSSFICAQNTQGTYVELHKMDTSQTGGGIFKPKKAPARRPDILISAFLNQTSYSLDFYSSNGTYTYFIYDETNAVVLQGALVFSIVDESSIDLSFLSGGEYVIVISRGSDSYEGFFEL